MDREALKRRVMELERKSDQEPSQELRHESRQDTDRTECRENVFAKDCRIIAFLLRNCDIEFDAKRRFFVVPPYDYEPSGERFTAPRQESKEAGMDAYLDNFAFNGFSDFGHTAPDWEAIFRLGLPGLRDRVEKTVAEGKMPSCILDVWDAVFSYVERVAAAADANGRADMASSLRRLLQGAPDNLEDAIRLSFVYYTLQHHFEGTYLRTMGRVDSMWKELADKLPENETRQLITDWLLELEAYEFEANIPFALGGTDLSGDTLCNDLSELILDCYGQLVVPHVKIHALISDNTPLSFLEKAFRLIRNGSNSIVFLSDRAVIDSLIRQGEPREDAVRYSVVGCYECGGFQEITCSCNGYLNIVKAVEYAITGGQDMMTGQQLGLPWEHTSGLPGELSEDLPEETKQPSSRAEFMAEVRRQLKNLCQLARQNIDIYEACYDQQHGAPFLTSVYEDAITSGRDIYTQSGARYNNSSINAIGLATAADAIDAYCRLVFEEKRFSSQQMLDILKHNWEGQELLRLTIRNKYPKFGQGKGQNESIADELVEELYQDISGHHNRKGGIYRLGTFSINKRWEFGEHTAASADGRKAGEPLSQNTGATFGLATEGVTAHLMASASVQKDRTPNGSILDLDLHASSVKGSNGLAAMIGTLRTYFLAGGFAVHYNVLNTDVLKAAIKDPSLYPDLQVRLCGWNVLFSTLSDKEKAEFITRSEGESA